MDKRFSELDRQTLRRVLALLQHFQSLDAEMQMPQAVTLVTVALREGISLTDLAEVTAQATSSASRNVAALGVVHRKGKPGHGLMRNVEDPTERRRKQHWLTSKGRQFLRRMIETVS